MQKYFPVSSLCLLIRLCTSGVTVCQCAACGRCLERNYDNEKRPASDCILTKRSVSQKILKDVSKQAHGELLLSLSLHSHKMPILSLCPGKKKASRPLISSVGHFVLYLHILLSKQSNSGSWGDRCHSKRRTPAAQDLQSGFFKSKRFLLKTMTNWMLKITFL